MQRVDDARATRIDRPESIGRQGFVVVGRMHQPPVVERRLGAGDDVGDDRAHAVGVPRGPSE